MRWNTPFYGVKGQGWFLGFHTFTRFVKVTFFRGTSLRPVPPGGAGKDARWIDIHEDDLDEEQMATWIRRRPPCLAGVSRRRRILVYTMTRVGTSLCGKRPTSTKLNSSSEWNKPADATASRKQLSWNSHFLSICAASRLHEKGVIRVAQHLVEVDPPRCLSDSKEGRSPWGLRPGDSAGLFSSAPFG